MSTSPSFPALDQFHFVTHTRVDVADTDLGGITYYGRYSRFIDTGVLAYRRHLGIPVLGPDGHQFVVRHLDVEYLSAAQFDDPLDIWARTAHVGRSSHTMQVAIICNPPGGTLRHVAHATVQLVGVSGYLAPRPTRMPADLARTLTEFEAR